MTDIEIQDFLEHHGVKGMKWGVRNEDKAAGKAAKREAKAQKHDAKANAAQRKIDAINASTPRSNRQKMLNRQKKQELLQQKTVELKAAKDTREGRLTDKQKKVAIGAGIAAGIVAAGVTYSMVQSGEGHRLAQNGKAFLRGEKQGWKRKESLTGPKDVNDILRNVVQPINADFGGLGTKQNCRRCTFAYEMRRRGYDVAATKTTNAHGQTIFGVANALDPDAKPAKATGKLATFGKLGLALSKMREGVDAGPVADYIDSGLGKKRIERDGIADVSPVAIFKALSKEPNGSRGELAVSWGIGGGHSVAYEIINGKPHIFDTQSGKSFKTPFEMGQAYSAAESITGAALTRLDNVDLNTAFLGRWLKDA